MGQLSLNLNNMLKPAKDSDKCGLHQLPEINLDNADLSSLIGASSNTNNNNNNNNKSNPEPKYVSLFEQRRLKGWWPCIVELSDKREIAVNIFYFIQFKYQF